MADIPLADLMKLEADIVQLSEGQAASAPYAAFAVQQMLLAPGALSGAAHKVASSDAIARYLQGVAELLGISGVPASGSASLDWTMIAVTPALRANWVFRPVETVRRMSPWDGATVVDIPLMLVGLHMIARLAEATGIETVTFQTIARLQRDFDAVLRLCCVLDSVVAWRPGVMIEGIRFSKAPLDLVYLRLCKALLPRRRRGTPRPLGDLLREHLAQVGVDRVTFVKQFARAVAGRLVTGQAASEAVPSVGFRQRARSTLQRWTFDLVSEQRLRGVLRLGVDGDR